MPKKDKTEQDVNEAFGLEKTEKKELQLADDGVLQTMAGMGMSGVDPADIRPPQIILTQKSSDFSLLVDKKGEVAKTGQFFHTGKREIYEEFDCYFLWANKSKYIDRRKEDQPELEQYQVVGVLKEDQSLFGMTLRSSAMNVLSSLFSAAVSQKMPMFVYNCHMETKTLSNDKGEWTIPVCRVGEVERDQGVIDDLYSLTKKFDEQGVDFDDSE